MSYSHSPGQSAGRARWATAGRVLLICILTVAAYWPALQAGFIWDDDDYVTGNFTLRSVEGLRHIWFNVGATYQYYPLVHTTFWIEYQLWQLNPFGFHLVNVLLHALAAVLLWRVLLRLQLPGAWLAAVVWALHPVMVESVAWITERKNVLSAVFYFAAALVYLRVTRHGSSVTNRTSRATRHAPRSSILQPLSSPWYWLSFALFLCALFSKTVACSLPAALLLVAWWKNGRLGWGDVLPTIPFFAAGLALGLFTAWVEKHHVGALGADWNLSFFDRCLIAGRAVWFYAAKLLWPANLTFIYPRWEINTAVWWQWLFPLAALGVVGTFFLLRNKTGRGPLVAALFFGGTLFPALGFINVYPMRYSFVADHFQYLASVGLIVLVVSGMVRWSSRFSVFPDKLKLGLQLLLLLLLGTLSWQQTRVYRDLETLWRDTIAKNPSCWMALNNLGEVLRQQGKSDEADECYRAALRHKPDYPEALNNIGYGFFGRAQYEEAADYYRRAIQVEPRFAPAWSNLGAVQISQGDTTAAIQSLRHALELDPNNLDAMSNLSVALTTRGQFDEALRLAQTVIQSQPHRADAHINLGNVLLAVGRVDDAIRAFSLATQLDPQNLKAHTDAAGALASRGRSADAITHYTHALRLSPTNATLHYNLGVLFAATGRTPDAIQQFRQALQINPAYAEAANNLGVALTLEGNINQALKLFETAIRSKPDYAEAHNNLAYAFLQLGRRDDAIRHLREALRINPDYEQARKQLRDLGIN